MSKPVVRVVIAVLVSLAIIAAIAPSVQARLGGVTPKADSVAEHQVLGRTGLTDRANSSIYQFDYLEKDSSGGCNHPDSSLDD